MRYAVRVMALTLRHLLAAIAAALILAGCSEPQQPLPTGTLITGTLIFKAPSDGQRDQDLVTWSFLIQNTAKQASTPATLRIHVTYEVGSHPSGATVDRELAIQAFAAGDGKPFTLTTPYRGAGDYVGTAEIDMGGQIVARDQLFFETCGTC